MRLNDILAFVSHLSIALLVALGHQLVHDIPAWVQVVLLVLLVILIVILYRKIKNTIAKSREESIREELTREKEEIRQSLTREKEEIRGELEKQDRYNLLRRTMLDVLGDFVKERYRANFSLTTELRRLMETDNINVESVKTALSQADDIRREKVKQALGKVSQLLREDNFKKPNDADGENKDKMGVSFYAVTENEGEMVLEKRYRYFPNEGEPKTKTFKIGEGAAGQCWMERVPIVCENGGDDPTFKEMRAGQRSEYASMICIPAIADFPKEKVSELFGVLTIHSTERKGYFEKRLEQFWFDLFQPVCDALIYSGKSSELIDAIGNSFEAGLAQQEKA